MNQKNWYKNNLGNVENKTNLLSPGRNLASISKRRQQPPQNSFLDPSPKVEKIYNNSKSQEEC